MKTLTLCETCGKNEATYERAMYGDKHCEHCIIYGGLLQGIFNPIKETI